MKAVSELPVMKSCCKTCPFRKDKSGKLFNANLANQVTERTLFKAQQICHGTEGENREPRNRCKGSFDNNMEIYDRIGLGHLIIK